MKTIEVGLEINVVGVLIVGEEGSLVKSSGTIFDRLDVTVHSEIEAIRKAFAALKSFQLDGILALLNSRTVPNVYDFPLLVPVRRRRVHCD